MSNYNELEETLGPKRTLVEYENGRISVDLVERDIEATTGSHGEAEVKVGNRAEMELGGEPRLCN